MEATTSAQRSQNASSYHYGSAAHGHHHAYLLPALEAILASLDLDSDERRVFDVGCGNGSIAAYIRSLGFDVAGIDPSVEGIQRGRDQYPDLALYEGSAYDDLAGRFGQFPVVVSLEVVEHVYSPRDFAATMYDLVEEGGTTIISTPYHGYWKNLALVLAGKWDSHHSPLWDHGHIKFWSPRTLSRLLVEAGFETPRFHRVGRIPALAKSMIAVARKR